MRVCKLRVKRKTQNVDKSFFKASISSGALAARRRFLFRVRGSHYGLHVIANCFRIEFTRSRAQPDRCIQFVMNRKSLCFLVLLAVLPPLLFAQSVQQPGPTASKQYAYGERVQLNGIKNAGRISSSLYRGAQPQAQSLRQLKALGITTIVNLRGEDASSRERERKEAESLGLRFVSIPVGGFAPPTNEQVAKFLSIFHEPGEKVFVHCRFGDDRTGVFVATYRMAMDKWPAERALKEMYVFGFNGFWHPAMISFVRSFPERLTSAPALGSGSTLAPMADRFD